MPACFFYDCSNFYSLSIFTKKGEKIDDSSSCVTVTLEVEFCYNFSHCAGLRSTQRFSEFLTGLDLLSTVTILFCVHVFKSYLPAKFEFAAKSGGFLSS